MDRLAPKDERELRQAEGHLRAIGTNTPKVLGPKLTCRCPLCSGILEAYPTYVFLRCSKNSRHFLSRKELACVPEGELINLMKTRAVTWTCSSCGVVIMAVGEIGMCPACGFTVHPEWYGKNSGERVKHVEQGR